MVFRKETPLISLDGARVRPYDLVSMSAALRYRRLPRDSRESARRPDRAVTT
jgi:hypothetical protein